MVIYYHILSVKLTKFYKTYAALQTYNIYYKHKETTLTVNYYGNNDSMNEIN